MPSSDCPSKSASKSDNLAAAYEKLICVNTTFEKSIQLEYKPKITLYMEELVKLAKKVEKIELLKGELVLLKKEYAKVTEFGRMKGLMDIVETFKEDKTKLSKKNFLLRNNLKAAMKEVGDYNKMNKELEDVMKKVEYMKGKKEAQHDANQHLRAVLFEMKKELATR